MNTPTFVAARGTHEEEGRHQLQPFAMRLPLALMIFSGALSARTVIHVVVDDLGKSDLGFRNNMTHTPMLNRMAKE